jgi:voltage-gated potassium channel Kch
MFLILLLGTVFYRMAEGWSWLDSLYFSVITLSTVGYGDFNPTTPLSKIFTIAYIFLGISIFVSFASMLAKERAEIARDRVADKERKDTP